MPGAFPAEVPAARPRQILPVQSVHKQAGMMKDLPGKWPTKALRDAEWYQGNSDGEKWGRDAGNWNRPANSLKSKLMHKELGFAGTNIGRVSPAYLNGFKKGWAEGYNQGKMSWQPPAVL